MQKKVYFTKKKLHKLDEVIKTIKDNEMPLKSYALIHGDAKLSDSDKQEIEAWVKRIKNENQ
ncbi:MAG TPA: heme-binding domain-containing protein [Saprospiraceae bacterium]|nr:heme-binding domain-containing protein [Saprospiraceae bacterium]HQU95298.1 heme-binding domain-containing protein [Saprospiraceae bacterium]HQW95125.1 heme-binding domain-containing protein [Saprospiraceae bacterium]HRG43191.1 heme-binding domain-containing protein [Saprospiraceae bacterium]